MKKYILYGILLAYFVGCAIIINNGLHDIRVSSFRIGCIGRLYPKDMRSAVAAVRDVLEDMNVSLPIR